MAENKRSFLLYADLIHTVKKMPKEKAADLFITILEYVNDLNPKVDDLLVEIAFEPIKQQLKRDLRRYETIVEKRVLAGKKSAELRSIKANTSQQVLTDVKQEEHLSTNPTVIDNVTDTVNGTVTVTVTDNVTDIKKEESNSVTIVPLIVSYKIDFEVFWDEYDKKVGDKDKIKKKWDKISVETQNQILEYIPVYKLSQPEKKFRKNPDTFFNQKSWNDEIIISKPLSKLSAAEEAYNNSHNPYDNE